MIEEQHVSSMVQMIQLGVRDASITGSIQSEIVCLRRGLECTQHDCLVLQAVKTTYVAGRTRVKCKQYGNCEEVQTLPANDSEGWD